MQFFQKKVAYETLHEKLTRARLEQSITLDMAEKFTGVSRRYIQAIESGAYHMLPGEVYAENFIRRYAQFLGFDEHFIIDDYRKERKITKNTSTKNLEKNLYRSLKGVSRGDFFVSTKVVQRVAYAAILLSFFLYLGIKISTSLKPPALQLTSPEDNLIVSNLVVQVVGQTDSEVDVWINNLPILTDPDGNFSQLVELTLGINTLQVSAQKKHSRKQVIKRNILVVNKEDQRENVLGRR